MIKRSLGGFPCWPFLTCMSTRETWGPMQNLCRRHLTSMANRQWYGAIDQGTTSTRFMVFDLSGPQPVKLVKAKRPIPTVALHPGWAEQDPSLMIKSTIECINEVSEAIKSQYGISSLQDCLKGSSIYTTYLTDIMIGIGVTNQRETTIAWDAVTGQPLSPAICSKDKLLHIYSDS